MKIFPELNEWVFDKNISDDQRMVNITINFEYPAIDKLLHLPAKQRVEQINNIHQYQLKLLQDSDLLNNYAVNGTQARPTGVNIDIRLIDLHKFMKLDHPGQISINSITHANEVSIDAAKSDSFYTVKMTILIEVEGAESKMQDIEERYIMIKAASFDDAYDKIEKQKDEYAEPYLNSDGYLVRWRIDSFDDCYVTNILNLEQIQNPKGVEVFSKLKLRKRKTIWDGKIGSNV